MSNKGAIKAIERGIEAGYPGVPGQIETLEPEATKAVKEWLSEEIKKETDNGKNFESIVQSNCSNESNLELKNYNLNVKNWIDGVKTTKGKDIRSLTVIRSSWENAAKASESNEIQQHLLKQAKER